MNDSTIFVDNKNTRRTQQEKKRVNKRKENLFFTLFVFVLAHSSRDYKGREEQKVSNTQQPFTTIYKENDLELL